MFPIVIDTSDGYVNRLNIRGKIVKITKCSPPNKKDKWNYFGTIELKIENNVKQFPDNFVYCIIPCYEMKDLNIDNLINVKLTKVTLRPEVDQAGNPFYSGEAPYYGREIANIIDSKGKPFYWLASNSKVTRIK